MRNKRESADHGVQLSAHVAALPVLLERHQEQAFTAAPFGPQPANLILLDFARHVAQMFALVFDNENASVREFANEVRKEFTS